MILSDNIIRQMQQSFNILDPFSEGVQGNGVISYGLTSAGYDLRLGSTVLFYKNSYNEVIDPKRFSDEAYMLRVFDKMEAKEGDLLFAPPHSYLLAYSMEKITMPRHLKGRCVGKSTWARCGLVVNTTPLEPGWSGHLTIEIANTGPAAVRLFPGEGIAQLEFEVLSGLPDQDYAQKSGKYQNQKAEPTVARTKT